MKILFVFPNDYLSNGIPAGIALLSAILKQEGHEVRVFDFTFIKPLETNKEDRRGGDTIYLPTRYTLEDLVKNDPVESIEEGFEKQLKSFQPDLISLSSASGSFGLGIDLLTKFRSRFKCKVIAGGVHPSCAPEDALSQDAVDLICVGEGEELMIELCDCLSRGKNYRHIRNLGFKKRDGIQINEIRPFINLDVLPTPDWSVFDRRHLFRPFMGKVYQGSFYTMSRGCPYSCPYCVNGTLRQKFEGCGRYYRFEHPKTAIKHISDLNKLYNATWFKFADNSLMSMSERYLEELADGIIPLGINFACSIRPETTSERKISLLKKMGCVAMSVGIESGDEQLRKKILYRKMSNTQIEMAIALMKNYGMRVSTFNMIGLPGESRDNVFETIKLHKKLGVDQANVYIIFPYPGTEIAGKNNISFRDKNGTVIPESKAAGFNLSRMSPVEVGGLLKTFNLYLLLPQELWPVIRYAEEESDAGNTIFNALIKYTEGSLLKNNRSEV